MLLGLSLIAVLGAFHDGAAAPLRGYTIPLVDLADHNARQVIVDREEGQYLGHPTTVLLEDNQTIITVYPKGHGKGGIVMKRSTDNHKGADCAYPGVEVLPDGTFVATTYGHWTPDKKPYIVSIRFTLDELDALAATP